MLNENVQAMVIYEKSNDQNLMLELNEQFNDPELHDAF